MNTTTNTNGGDNTHDSYYVKFVAHQLGPTSIALYSSFTAFMGILSVIIIMISCMYYGSFSDKRNKNINDIINSVKTAKSISVVPYITSAVSK